MKIKVLTTFSFNKLAKQMPSIINNYLSGYAKDTVKGTAEKTIVSSLATAFRRLGAKFKVAWLVPSASMSAVAIYIFE